ncbi:MerR family transcriptional regulator [Colwellia sp. C1TZA3]|uniref:MerR family transcriptional regulator n=1 Tax=Colwellia sp. C1TZA3 TaxID=2508879 RepID=UPI0011B9578B|nr:MerR family transcriptional regulator [Colwellia sp. C1TZA3]TWX73896.1 MerR family transcriptional regulator [Colwellia sp. C1TZA3]
MKINQLAKLTNVLSKTIRYYEEVGLLPKASRNSNGYRKYSPADVERLIFIRRCRELQIPLEQIKILIQVQVDRTSSCREVDLLIEEQLEKVRKTISELSLLESTLHALAKSCSNDIVGECEILKKLHHHDH